MGLLMKAGVLCKLTLMVSILGEVGARDGRVRSVATGLGLHDIVAVDGQERALFALFGESAGRYAMWACGSPRFWNSVTQMT